MRLSLKQQDITVNQFYNKTNFMSRSYSKIRHMQESNEKLEKRLISEQPTAKPTETTKEMDKAPNVVNYREIKSQLTFAPQFKTGTPVIELKIPGGPYYLTPSEFEEYRKTKPNVKFIKL